MPAPDSALLMTDVVDSTKLAQALGDTRMAALWSAHDRAARDLLRRWRGREIEKTDGLLALFTSVDDAVRFALDYHAALAALDPPLPARAAVHVGPVTVREADPGDADIGARRLDVDGLAKPIVARVMALSLGAQTLLTESARASLGSTDLRATSHGHWRLKGLPEPIELFEVGDERSPFLPPPDEAKAYRVVRQGDLWMPVRDIRHTLPAERDGFVGRGDLLRDLARRIENGARLVSVLGIGGTGKTRFALHFARSFLGDYTGGLWFCDLSQARSVEGIHFAVAQGLEVPLGKSDAGAQLADAIAGRGRCLIVLDNFEQVARHAEETVGHWLDRAPSAAFLVTTREALGIVGEEALPLPPLPARDAVELFKKRAASARRGRVAPDEDDAAIGPLVAVLDGLPLAIELAAARAPVMGPRALLARMNERFSVLASRGGRLDRQATLRATFDWSWDLLDDVEKAAFAELSVFEGSFPLGAARDVLSGLPPEVDFAEVDLLQSLVDKSLVRPAAGDRFEMLRSVRDYAEIQLRSTGRYPGSGTDALWAARLRHGRHFAAFAADSPRKILLADLENFIVAAERAIERGDAETAVSTIEGAWRILERSGPFRAAIGLAEAASSMTTLSAPQRTRLDVVAGRALLLAGEIDLAQRRLEAAHENALLGGPPRSLVSSLSSLAEVRFQKGQIEQARHLYESALKTASAPDDPLTVCALLSGLAICQEHLGFYTEARLGYLEALRVAREAEDSRWIGGAMNNLGQFFANQGLPSLALPLYEQSVRVAQSLGDRQWEGNFLCNLGLLQHEQGDSGSAVKNLTAALHLAREVGHTRLESVVLCNLGLAHATLGNTDAAREDYEAAISIASKRGDRRSRGQFLGYLGMLDARDGRHAKAEQSLTEAESLLRQVGDPSSLGILLCGKAEMAHLASDVATFAAALLEAEKFGVDIGAEPASEFGVALSRCRALGRAELVMAIDPPSLRPNVADPSSPGN